MITIDNKEIKHTPNTEIVIPLEAKSVFVSGEHETWLDIRTQPGSQLQDISISNSALYRLKVEEFETSQSTLYIALHSCSAQNIEITESDGVLLHINHCDITSSLVIDRSSVNLFVADSKIHWVNMLLSKVGRLSPKLGSVLIDTSRLGTCSIVECYVTAPVMDSTAYQSVDLSGSHGPALFEPYFWADYYLEEHDKSHYLAYKCFNLFELPPERWVIEKNSLIEEIVDYDRHQSCSHGINCATAHWLKTELGTRESIKEIWRVAIPKNRIVIPYNTTGKFRSSQALLIDKISHDELSRLAKAEADKYEAKDPGD